MGRGTGTRSGIVRRFDPAVLLLGAVLGLGLPLEARTQELPFEFDARGGVGIPSGELSDIQDVGGSFGLGFAWWFHPRFAVRADFDVDVLSGAEENGPGMGGDLPDLNLWHYNAGFEYLVTPPSQNPWRVTVNVGVGGTTIDSDDFMVVATNPVTGEVVNDFSESYLTTNGGVKMSYDVTETLAVFVGGQAFVAFPDEDETAVFNDLTPAADPTGFDTAVTFPVTVGVKVRF